MPFELEEEVAARIVGSVMRDHFGQELGPRRRHDGSSPEQLQVDFTYDEAKPNGVAIEVTGHHRSGDPQTSAEAQKLEQDLSISVVQERLGGWIVVLERNASIRKLKPLLLEMMRAGDEIRPDEYSSSDLDAQSGEGLTEFLEFHRTLKDHGLVSLERIPINDHGVRHMVIGGGIIEGFSEALDNAIQANVGKLEKARPRTTHLVILVYDYQTSAYSSATPAPDLPEGLDYLWVLIPWGTNRGPSNLWILRRGETQWEELTVDYRSLTN